MAGNTDYKNKWIAQNRERINLVVPKGYKEKARAAADDCGMSLNGFIMQAVNEKIAREAK